MCKISIIAPVYNIEKYLDECFKSIQNQTLKDFEVLCIEDCSTDNSKSIIKKYVQIDNRFKLIENSYNKGVGASRNIGIENATGEYIFFIDPDDVILSNCLDILYSTAKQKKSFITCCNVLMWWEDDSKTKFKVRHKRRYRWNKLKDKNFEALNRVIWNKLYRRSIFDNPDIRFIENVYHEDIDFYWKCFVNYPKAYVIRKKLYLYRQRVNSFMSCSKPDDFFKNHAFILNNIFNYLNKTNKYSTYQNSFKKRVKQFIGDAHNKSMQDYNYLYKNLNNELKQLVDKITITENS